MAFMKIPPFTALEQFARTAHDPQMTPCKKFWKVCGDPTGNFDKDFLIWNRPVYYELERQIEEDMTREYRVFIVSGTAGAGLSMFALYFVLKQATKPGKPLLLKNGEEVYIIDALNSCAVGPYDMTNSQITELRFDKDVWLVIDGLQDELVCQCKVLQVCSANKETLGKLGETQKLYMPVWSEEEVNQFKEDYEPYRDEYESKQFEEFDKVGMCVPTLNEVRAQYKVVGGVARYLLQQRKLEAGRERVSSAIKKVVQDGIMMRNMFIGEDISHLIGEDSHFLLHFVPTSNLTLKKMRFSSEHVWEELRKVYNIWDRVVQQKHNHKPTYTNARLDRQRSAVQYVNGTYICYRN